MKMTVEQALIAQRRAALEEQYDREAETEGNAIRRSSFLRPRRPRKPVGHMPPVAAQGR